MRLRYGLLLGPFLLSAAAPALAQTKLQTSSGRHPNKPALKMVPTVPHTLVQALAATYSYNPALLAERARLRATDEDVPQALAGWRPTVVVAGTLGYGDGMTREVLGGQHVNLRDNRDIGTAQATVTQPVYEGGRVHANVHRAKNTIYAERATLINTEETAFNQTVSAYVGVIQARQILELDRNNERVLSEQLRATQDRFHVGEITQTDVAQAQAALASAVATRQTAMGNLRTAEATYVQAVGTSPPADLTPPQPLQVAVASEQQAARFANGNNPLVINALFNLAAARNQADAAFGALLPSVSVQGQAFQSNNSSEPNFKSNGYQIVANLSVPLYQGGSQYSLVRQARETVQQDEKLVADSQRTAVQNAVAAWDTLQAARAAVQSSRVAIQSSTIALEGTERQALVGTATTLDVLTEQQNLLNSQVTLVQNLANLVTASYSLASAIGRLTARDLNLPVPLYDDTAYYEAVKNKWWGVGVPDPAKLYRAGATK